MLSWAIGHLDDVDVIAAFEINFENYSFWCNFQGNLGFALIGFFSMLFQVFVEVEILNSI